MYIFDKGGDLIVSSRQPAVGSPKEESSQAPETFEIFGKSVNDRIIFLNNGVKFIIAREGDDLFLLASDFQIYTWQLYKYNDLGRNDEIKPGMKIYLEKKKAASDYKAHIAGEGETLQSVSQDYGIRLKSLCRMNGKQKGDTITKGEKLRLN